MSTVTPASTKEPSGFGISHTILVNISNFAVDSFFSEVKVLGTENVPAQGGVVLTDTLLDCRMNSCKYLDPACLSYAVIEATKSVKKRYIHYWVKDSLFKNPALGALLLNAGNIPVDRKTKNNQVLFKGTFEALVRDEVIGVFPEGTSHTHSRLMPVKDGVGWTALEYVKYLEDQRASSTSDGEKNSVRPAIVIPVGITYSDKTKYRSRVAIEFGTPITVDEYSEQFLSTEEVEAKSAVKRLTKSVEDAMIELTVNAPDWDTLNAAILARQLLWANEKDLRMENFREVTQTLIDLLANPPPSSNLSLLKEALLSYHFYLQTARLSHSSLSQIPLPSTLDPSRPTPLPTRFSTLALFLKDLVSSLIRLPFFALPFLVNVPVYLVGRYGAKLVEDEEETKAQMKLVFGLLVSAMIYPACAIALYKVAFSGTWVGGIVGLGVAGALVFGLINYHLTLIDDNYDHARKLVATFRILLGIWCPPSWDIILTPPSQASSSSSTDATISSPTSPRPTSPLPPPYEPNPTRIPSRRLVRQVLRARLKASKSLESYLLSLESGDDKVPASAYLATSFITDPVNEQALSPSASASASSSDSTGSLGSSFDIVGGKQGGNGERLGKEVVTFLRDAGARIIKGAAGELADTHWLEDENGSGEEKKEI
ncbi:Phospholipid/glycerol acyltransferase [Phaffia rhodozyma]|uniref:Phospholipid/glycerol acyltransferase n=1 Tax=Phaffia rhodozyma TaxID=264483 RepID=A0A0F7SNZ2_PHARH|nr:Phospholipid/glycerol acyltransferase [Phaffia rhodozyma]